LVNFKTIGDTAFCGIAKVSLDEFIVFTIRSPSFFQEGIFNFLSNGIYK